MYNLGINLSHLNAVSQNMDLTPEEHYKMMRYLDTNLKAEDRLNQLVSTPIYQNSSDASKRRQISNLWRTLVDQAKAYGAQLAAERGGQQEVIQEQIEELTAPPSEPSRFFRETDEETEGWLDNILNWGGGN